MIRITLAALLALSAAGCAPRPRSAAYFETHRDEAAKVVAACASGQHRGQECENAQAGVKADKRDARMRAYEKNF